MKLKDAIAGLQVVETAGDLSVDITGVTYDSRKSAPGILFVAMQGEVTDGHSYIDAAIKAGASAVVAEKMPDDSAEVPFVIVEDSRAALADIAGALYGHPDRELQLVGITGTNGKSSVAQLVHAIMRQKDGKAGLIGTIVHDIGDSSEPASLTTPEASDTLAMMRHMREVGCNGAVMEVSSVALDRDRVRGFYFDAVVFTNFTRDHLDYHGDMERYFAAKRALFNRIDDHDPTAVINLDDPAGKRLLKEIDLPAVTFGMNSGADVHAEGVNLDATGSSFLLVEEHGRYELNYRLLGRFNVMNVLAAWAVGKALGYSSEVMKAAIETVVPVRGRFEPVQSDAPFGIVVDYAHTDDALLKLLQAANEIATGRVIAIFGCGGDRDKGKRPIMGQHAVTHADIAILTSDNPRTEDPLAIIDDVIEGINEVEDMKAELIVQPDRRKAIHTGIEFAEPGDLVVIAGKGHEDYQILGTHKIHFDDREVALEALKSR